MCLALPARVIEIRGPEEALVELDGVRRLVSTALVDELAVGDFVLLHVGYALTRVDPDEAAATLAMLTGDRAEE